MFRLGLPELLLLLIILGIPVLFAWRVVGKTGNPAPLGLLFLVPLANLVLLGYLALSEWPIERRLRSLEDGRDRS